jgi:DNA-binding beta-propeller fold protein YncE
LKALAALALALTASTTPVPGPPSALALSRDRATLYVGLDRLQGRGGGLAMYARDGDAFRERSHVDVPGGITGLALTPDGATLIVATRVGLAAVSTHALAAGAVRGIDVVRDADAPGTNQVAVSADGGYAFATDTQTATLAVARLIPGTEPALQFVGHVPLDRAPDGLALSLDGSTLYVASEVAGGDARAVPGARDARLGRASCSVNFGPSGVLSAIDVRAAIADPSHAVVARIAAGCAPARVAVSPDGRVVWVSVRGEGRVLAFDAARMRADPLHAVLANVAVGPSPIGLALSPDGSQLLVANSAGGGDPDEVGAASLSLIDVRAALRGAGAIRATLPAGKRAREILAVDDRVFLVTDYGANTVEAVRMPLERSAPT